MKKKINVKLKQQFKNLLLKNPILYQSEICQCKEKKYQTVKIKEQIFNLPICSKCNFKIEPKPSEYFYLNIFQQIRIRKAILAKRCREGYADVVPDKKIEWKKWV